MRKFGVGVGVGVGFGGLYSGDKHPTFLRAQLRLTDVLLESSIPENPWRLRG